MLPDKKRQIGSIVGMLIMMAILVFANFGGTWSVLRITLLVIGVTGVIGSAICRIIQILRGQNNEKVYFEFVDSFGLDLPNILCNRNNYVDRYGRCYIIWHT